MLEYKINNVTAVPAYFRIKQDYINFVMQATLRMLPKLSSKIWCNLSQFFKDMTLYPHMYHNVCCNLPQINFSIQEWHSYKSL